MEVQFTGMAPTIRTVSIPEEDMAALYDIVVNYFLALIPYADLPKAALIPEKEAIVDFLQKYKVPIDHPQTVVNFFQAALGKPND